MAISTLNNGESGLSIRTKINDNFTDVDDRISGLGDASALDVGTTAGTVAAGDDSRFLTLPIEGLDPADELEGDELFALLQDGIAVKSSVEDTVGDPRNIIAGYDRSRYRFYSAMGASPPTYSNNTDATLWSAEPFVARMSGTGAAVKQGATTIFKLGVAICGTGTDTTGRASLSFCSPGPLFNPDVKLDQRFRVVTSAAPTALQDYIAEVGLTTIKSAVATHGMFFRLTKDSPNWVAVLKNGGSETPVDTGVAAASASKTLRIALLDEVNVQYYIDGALVATISTDMPETFDPHFSGVGIYKSAGTTERTIALDTFYYSAEADVVAEGNQYI